MPYKIIKLTVVFLLFFFNANSQKNDISKLYEAKHFTSKQGTLPYRIYKPKQTDSQTEKLPAVIFLHGAGERGNDNSMQLTHLNLLFKNKKTLDKYKAYVIAPQCENDYRWVEVDWSAKSHSTPKQMSKYLSITMQLLDSLTKSLSIDTDRIYVVGLSMGGFGTWDLLARYPDKFAAAVAVCGGADLNDAPKIAHIPVWVFHGKRDRLVSVSRSRDMVKALKKQGGNPIYTEYPTVGHGAWIKAYSNPNLLKWMFAKVRGK